MTQPSLNEKIEQILAEEDAQIEQNSWQGKLKKIWQAQDKKQAVKTQLLEIWKGLSTKAIFTLFLILAFIFLMTFSVLL